MLENPYHFVSRRLGLLLVLALTLAFRRHPQRVALIGPDNLGRGKIVLDPRQLRSPGGCLLLCRQIVVVTRR